MFNKANLMWKRFRPGLTSIVLFGLICVSGGRSYNDGYNLNVFPILSRLLIILYMLVRLLIGASNVVPKLPSLDESFYFILQGLAVIYGMSGIKTEAVIF